MPKSVPPSPAPSSEDPRAATQVDVACDLPEFFDDSPDQSKEYLRLALALLGEHGLPVNPINYWVCYEYVAGRRPQLNDAIDRYRSSTGPLSSLDVRCVFEKCIADDWQQQLTALNGELRRVLERVLGEMGTAGEEVSRIRSSVSRAAHRLESDPHQRLLTSIVNVVLDEISNFQESSGNLHTSLRTSHREVQSLRHKLTRMHREANTDSLTGLLNRRGLNGAFIKMTHETQQMAAIMIDIDHFKQINDSFGHLVGDDVLRTYAGILKKMVRTRDVVSRFGGEEFVILLADTTLTGARTVAEQLRRHFDLKEWKLRRKGTSLGNITLSAGVATHVAEEPLDELLLRADRALYRAKKEGRNKVCVDDTTVPASTEKAACQRSGTDASPKNVGRVLPLDAAKQRMRGPTALSQEVV